MSKKQGLAVVILLVFLIFLNIQKAVNIVGIYYAESPTSSWKVVKKTIKSFEEDWVVEYIYKDSTYFFKVSVGFNDRGALKYALNAYNLKKAREYIPPTYIVDGFIWFEEPNLIYIGNGTYTDGSPFVHRYLDDKIFSRTNILSRPVPPGLPRYIPRKILH